MPIQKLNSPMLAWPPAADGVTVTPPGSAWGNSAWVQLVASTSAAAILLGIAVRNFNTSTECEVDIGTGAAASEVVITTFVFNVASFGGNYAVGDSLALPIPVDNIGNGVRVAVRIRTRNGTAVGANIAAYYSDKPISGSLLVTANPVKCVPSAADGKTLTSGVLSWANGSWVEISSGLASAIILTGVGVWSTGVGLAEIDIGIGGAGSEVVIYTTKQRAGIQAGPGGLFPLRSPLDVIAASTRIAARNRNEFGSQPDITKLNYIEKPI